MVRWIERSKDPPITNPEESQRIVTPMPDTSVKQEAQRLVESLPDEATWEDLMYRIYVRQAIEAGLEDSHTGRTVEVQQVRTHFGRWKQHRKGR